MMQWIREHFRPPPPPPLQPEIDWLTKEADRMEEIFRRNGVAIAVDTGQLQDEDAPHDVD